MPIRTTAVQQTASANAQPAMTGRAKRGGTSPAYFFVRQQGKWQKIVVQDILFVEARKNYCKISTSRGDVTALITLKRLEALLSPAGFCRVNRAFIVAFDWIASFDRQFVYGPAHKIPIGEVYRTAFTERLLLLGEETKEQTDGKHRVD